jgi:outer membrane protein assembly factor BamB
MTAPAGRGGRGGPQGLHVVAPDGVLHVLGENSGIDVQKPLPFLPPGARPTGLSVVDGIAYVLTSRECGGGVPSGAHAVPLAGENHTVASWESNGAPIGLPAFGTEGTVYVSIAGESRTDGTSNAVVALEPRTLRLKAWFAPGSDAIATGPMVVRHRDRDLVVVAMRSGRLTVLDGASVGGSDHKTTLAQSEPGTAASPRGLASHVDGDGRAWVLMSIDRPARNGAVVAWTLDDAGGLKEGWTSTGLASPLPPVVVNGVVFVASNGAAAGGFGGAMLQALDPATGRSLWNSGRAMGGAVAGTLLVGNSQVYVATSTRTVFAFGFAMDR